MPCDVGETLPPENHVAQALLRALLRRAEHLAGQGRALQVGIDEQHALAGQRDDLGKVASDGRAALVRYRRDNAQRSDTPALAGDVERNLDASDRFRELRIRLLR